ncbi:MAG: hypothetical protein O7C67_19555 [Gammaproteobacteria bacterium]|nr:hypothetical protein [Gammaproteobacteria bacterium]
MLRARAVADDAKTQIRKHFVIVQLTLLSIVVALILENLLSSLRDNNPISLDSIEGWIALLEVALVLLSALATYAGFTLSLSFPQKRPQVIDFLMPFGLLISMQIAIGFLMPGAVHYFLLAMGSASLIAGLQLISDWRLVMATSERPSGAGVPALLQMSIALWDWLGAWLIYVDLISLPGALAFVAVAVVVQLIGVSDTLRGWITSTR